MNCVNSHHGYTNSGVGIRIITIHQDRNTDYQEGSKILWGDMIEVFKITHDLYDPDVSLNLAYHSGTITRDNKYKLINHRFHYDLRKYYFSARIVNIWNSLPNHAVNVFKARLDRFWMDQDVKFDFTADLTGTGDR